jgi:hypothetical protein
MERLESSDWGPMPLSLSSWGVLKAPPLRMTSLRAWAAPGTPRLVVLLRGLAL